VVEEAKAMLRSQDILARIGGEEFVVLLPETDIESSCEIAERLRARIARVLIRHDKMAFGVTISAGVARVDLAATVGESLKRADAALYSAKRAGRNRVTVAE
jgi:diguanylate cyclase (GGDEF)-like protein